jgi:hypothetical protein
MSGQDKELLRFPLLHQAWECDPWAVVMERPDGTRYWACERGKKPEHPEDLGARIMDLEATLALTRAALELLEGKE